ncbi:hypothetical protein KEH51_05915 [[Brevibacterium] frigoritolerans]|uniref:Uncharacterized protein n=1 Tax=Peribacillus frigoritolerans TaxID=450367 RepID=A0A941J6A0_9BACI|nr:hypothetical protein [Peribacillus frigoritolerans]
MSLFGKRDNAASDVPKLANHDDTVHTVLMFHKGGIFPSKRNMYINSTIKGCRH